MLLVGKTAIVTGGSRGIGRAIVQRFLEEGANVVFTYRSSVDAAEALVAEWEAKKADFGGAEAPKVLAVQSDAADFEASNALCEEVKAKFERVDVVVNNAGITRDNLLLRMKPEDFDHVVHNNLRSVYNLTKSAVRPMLRQRAGSIINISSIIGMRGNAGQANYAAAKAGIIGFSKSMAQELGGKNIRCNVVAPGFIDTDMTDKLPEKVREQYLQRIPLKRFADPKEVADVCVFLASDLSTYVSGQVLSVCGALNC